jgi:hypothetical protein
VYDAPHGTAIGEVAIMQEHPRLGIVRITVQMIDAIRVEGAGTPEDAVNLVVLFQQKGCEVGSVLASNTGD